MVVPMHFEMNLSFVEERYKSYKCIPHTFTTFKTYMKEN